MPTILSWDKPAREMPIAKWQAISADGAPPGVYTPNMSVKDAAKWRAKLIRGADPRVEIRKTAAWANGLRDQWVGYNAQLCLVVRKTATKDGPQVLLSMNSKTALTLAEANEMHAAIAEALVALG